MANRALYIFKLDTKDRKNKKHTFFNFPEISIKNLINID